MKKSIYFHIDEYNRDTVVTAGLYKNYQINTIFFSEIG